MGQALNIMLRGRLALPLFFVTCFLALPVWAADNNAVNWYACSNSTECVKASALCGSITAVNAKYKDAHEKDMLERGMLVQCNPVTDELIALNNESSVWCEQGTCAVKKPDFDICADDAECVKVMLPCGNHKSINTKYLKAFHDEEDAQNALGLSVICSELSTLQAKQEAQSLPRCKQGKCVLTDK